MDNSRSLAVKLCHCLRSIMWKYFPSKYESIKTEYLFRTPKGKWLFVLNMGMFFLKMIGIPILDLEFEVWWYSYISGIAFVDSMISFFFTIWYYADTPLKGILYVAILGIVIPVRIIFSSYLDKFVVLFSSSMCFIFSPYMVNNSQS